MGRRKDAMQRTLLLAAAGLSCLLCALVAPLSAQTIEVCESPFAAFGTAGAPSLTREISVDQDETVVDINFSTRLPFASNFSAFYEPEGPGALRDFAGESADGEWLLTLSDEFENGDSGVLCYWGMRMFMENSPPFLRGDVNGDGMTAGIQDTLYILRWAFTGGAAPPCMDAADVDGNNTVSGLSDGLKLLGWAFLGGAEPPAPGPTTCGPDNDVDKVSCDTPPDCD